jgi:hypothetical protein
MGNGEWAMGEERGIAYEPGAAWAEFDGAGAD